MKKQKLYTGGRKIREGTRQTEAHRGRTENRADKSGFSDGSRDARDTDSRSPAAQAMSKRAAVPRKKAGGPADE